MKCQLGGLRSLQVEDNDILILVGGFEARWQDAEATQDLRLGLRKVWSIHT